MIKSKFSAFGLSLLWIMTVLIAMATYLACAAFLRLFGFHFVNSALSHIEIIIVLIFYLPLIIIGFVQIKTHARFIYINEIQRTISIRNYFTRFKKTYDRSEFEGYIDTLVKSPHGDFRIIYLVKNKKLYTKISARFISNIEALEKGLHNLPYLGFYEHNLLWATRAFFTKKFRD